MKISKKTREQAALICAIAACETKEGDTLSDISTRCKVSRAADRLARAAYERTFYSHWAFVEDLFNYEFACAEAEALLRTGWTP